MEKITKEYKEFEMFCKKNKISFDDDVFNKVHLDSGNLFYLYNKIIYKTTSKIFEDIKGKLYHRDMQHFEWNLETTFRKLEEIRKKLQNRS